MSMSRMIWRILQVGKKRPREVKGSGPRYNKQRWSWAPPGRLPVQKYPGPGALLGSSRLQALIPGFTPCFYHYSKISLPSWSLSAVRGIHDRLGELLVGMGTEGSSPPPTSLFLDSFS